MRSEPDAPREVTTLSQMLRDGELTPSLLVESCLARIQKHEGRLRAMTQVFDDEARERARALERGGPGGPLWGIPWVAKDNLATRVGKTTCGSRLLQQFRSPYDAAVVERLEQAGAILLGKTNLDEFAMGSSTENSAFGASRNPWNLDCVPGGSSGGSAAAVASGYAAFALGSDTGGSIRQPASFCGVVGFKPTYGRVSRYGLVAFASSLDQIGPLTRTSHDAARVLEVIAGHDARDSTSLAAPAPDVPSADEPLGVLRIGVPRHFVHDGVDAAVRDDFEQTLTRFEAAGAEVVDVELPHVPYAVAAYYVIATAEASSNLARYDGVRYTSRDSTATNLGDLLAGARTAGFGAEAQRRILLGTFVLSAGYYDAYYRRAQKVRTLIRADFEAAFERCEVIALPSSPTVPFRLGERTEDPLQMYLSDVFTVPANLVGGPAISLPTGVAAGLPLGVQLYGRPMHDADLLRTAAWAERWTAFQRHEVPSDGG